ncbi:MAG TPA: dehydrogenase, partial [Methylomirabilota bacterium]|nr:dehydrogenase [Methylomirabilota bacterium]
MRPGVLPVVCLLCMAPQSAPAADSPSSGSPPASPALPPDAALRSFQIEPGFQIDLFASEPMVQEPVAITFDPDGRLWVVEMRGFMPDLDGTNELAPVGRVSVLEDTDGDGQADRATVFLDQLVLPRAIAALPGGILIADHRRLLYARDLDGDLRADSIEVVDPDYAPGANPEHQPNGLLPALDNWIYNGESRFRYRLLAGRWIKDETELRGQWGITQDDRGRLLYNYNWSQLHADLLPPNYLNRNPRHLALSGINVPLATNQFIHPIRPNTGVNRGDRPGVLDEQGRLKQYASACAPLVYRGNQFPPRYRGNVLICDPAAHIVRRSVLTGPPLAPFATNGCVQSEFLASTDERFRPVWLANGPDGALYLADMYRGIIQHKAYMTPHLRHEILTRNLEQPIHLGRIYRITHSEGPAPRPPIVLSQSPPASLLDLLSHPNAWHRESAQRLLIHHADSSLNPDLLNIALHAPNPIGRLHALWTLEGRQFTNAAELFETIHDPDTAVQAGAIRIIEALCQIPSQTRTRLETTLTDFSRTASEPIRLQAILSLGNLRPEGFLGTFLEFATLHSESPLARDALVSGLHGLEMRFLQRLLDSPAWDAGSPGR